MKGKVQTVLGLAEPNDLGLTLTHEHLTHSIPLNVFKKPIPTRLQHIRSIFQLHNLFWLREYPYFWEENLEFNDEPTRLAIFEEMCNFKLSGGGTIVENSSVGIRGDQHHIFLKKLSEDTGVNIIAGTGFYVAASQSANSLCLKKEEIESLIRNDLLSGVDGSEIKCGVIGEIGCSWPLHEFERRVLESAAAVQENVLCPVIIHPGRNKEAPDEIMRIFLEAGGRAKQTAMAHLERTLLQKEDLADFADIGCFCELDLFGIEVSHYQPAECIDMPSDAQRIAHIGFLIDQGFSDRIVISHDIHTKHRLMKFGGHGYSHILNNIMPRMLTRGISKESVEKILIYNPQTLLTFQ